MERFPGLTPACFVLPPEQGGLTWDLLVALSESLERCPVPLRGIYSPDS